MDKPERMYKCETCKFETKVKCNYDRHNTTRKHLDKINPTPAVSNEPPSEPPVEKANVVEYSSLDMGLAKQFLQIIGDNVLLSANVPYIYEGRLWVADYTKKKLQRLMAETLIKYYWKYYRKQTQAQVKTIGIVDCKNILKIINDLQTDKKQRSVLSQVLLLLPDSTVEFDVLKPYYFVFNNVAFDMKARKVVVIEKEDYITQSAKYDYEEPSLESIQEMKKILKEIHPDKENRDCYTSVLRSGCIGVRMEKFILANGGGRNGKGLLSALMSLMLGGDYYYDGNVTTLTEKQKGGANPEIANMDKKRLTVFKEPESDAYLQFGVVKALTGDATINARGLYCNNTVTTIQATIVTEVNGKIKINGKIDDSAVERWINVDFPNCFTDNSDLVDNITKFPQNKKYKSLEWQKGIRCALFKILLECPHDTIYTPKSVSAKTMEYLLDNDSLLKFFNEHYEFVDDAKASVTCADMFITLRQSAFYENLSKYAKREEYSKKALLQKVKENLKLKMYFHDRKKIDGVEYFSVLTHYKLKDTTAETEGF